MMPSNSNGNNSISYTDQAIFHRPFFTDINPNSKQEDPPLSLFHFPSPFIHYEDDVFLQYPYDLLLQQQQLPLTADNSVAETLVNKLDSNKNINEIMGNCKKKCHSMTTEQTLRKRSSKRDRHSKINTAQGPRDRRMRLSLDIARRFFDLQDMLGYDKASKTVEWLLSKAKPAIKELARGLPQMNGSYSVGAKSASSTSECEVVSGIDEAAINGDRQMRVSKVKPSACVTKEKRSRQLRKAAFHTLARESREKARARARERTKEKMWSRSLHESKLFTEATNQDLNQVGSWSPFGTGEESGSQSHNINPPLEVLAAEVEEPSSHEGEHLGTSADMVDDSLVSMGKWSPFPILHYLHNIGIFQEVSSNKKFPDLPNIDSARTYSSYCAMTGMHLSTDNDQDGIPNSNFLTTPYDCLQHQLSDFQFY